MPKLKPNQFILSDHVFTEIPALFQTEMVKAILDDRKKVTRRDNRLDEINECPVCWTYHGCSPADAQTHVFARRNSENKIVFWEKVKCPFGKAGDILWARENWRHNNLMVGTFQYQADYSEEFINTKKGTGFFKPSIHIPKSAARIWLMVEEIRVERVQDISEADAIAEGIEMRAVIDPEFDEPVRGWKDYQTNDWITTGDGLKSPEERSFRSLWKSINGEESWNSNPWVWVIRFKVLSKTGRPSDAVILQNYLEVTGKEVPNA